MDMLARNASSPDAEPTTPAEFQAGDCLFASPGRVIHGRACLHQATAHHDVAAQATRLLAEATQGQADPVLLGLLPYDSCQPALLQVPAVMRRMAPPDTRPPLTPPAVLTAVEHPTGAQYEAGVQEALRHLDRSPSLRKLVLSRTLRITLAGPVDLPSLLGRLWQHNTGGHTYAMALDAQGSRYVLGASPELLVQRLGRQVRVHPLAGTAARHPDPTTDARQAQALLVSGKDLREHAVVVDAIETVLRPLCRTLDIPARPSLTSTARLWHLGTPICGELADPALSALDLAIALHPTPAVCGLPTDEARQAIAALEPFEREYFAGAVGWCDARGDGVWAVAIRCAQIADRSLTLYAGAGIVPGSIPAQERLETGNKLRTILDALGLEHLP